ncbi:hypothetical protein ABKY54_004549 [Vibrio harveyi]
MKYRVVVGIVLISLLSACKSTMVLWRDSIDQTKKTYNTYLSCVAESEVENMDSELNPEQLAAYARALCDKEINAYLVSIESMVSYVPKIYPVGYVEERIKSAVDDSEELATSILALRKTGSIKSNNMTD